MTLSARAQEIGRQIAAAPRADLSRALCKGLQSLLGWSYQVVTAFISDGTNQSTTFAAVIYSAPAASIADGAIPADNAAAVIDAVGDLDLAGLRDAYARVAAVKRLTKTPAPMLKGQPVSTNTLGIVYAQQSHLPIEALAAELALLNAETPHEQWLDMVVIAGVGAISYAVQFPGEGLIGGHLPPAPGAVRSKPPPMYIILAVHPVSGFAFNKLAAFLIGHLFFFSRGASLPNFQDLLEDMPSSAIVQSGYQFNLAGELVPVPPKFWNDRYIAPPAVLIQNAKREVMASIQLLPWQDGGVLLLRGKLPLDGLMIFLDPEVRTTTAVLRRPNDTQLSYVLPISHPQFVAFLQRFQHQSNMMVRPSEGKWIVQKLADEGASSPFMARLLMGVLRIRDAAYPDAARRAGFDDIYETLSTSLFGARDTAKEIDDAWRVHAEKVASGTCVRRSGRMLHIEESIDRELRRLTESFLNASARTLKHGLQQLAKELSVDLGFLFQKQRSFDRAVAKLANSDSALADYLLQARSIWSETLMLRRNAIEHEGWTLPRVTYRDEAGAVTAVEPLVDGKSVRDFVLFMLDRLCCAVEDLAMHLLSTRLPPGIGLHEIAPNRRVAEAPERFRITPLVGGETLWRLMYNAARFTDR